MNRLPEENSGRFGIGCFRNRAAYLFEQNSMSLFLSIIKYFKDNHVVTKETTRLAIIQK